MRAWCIDVDSCFEIIIIIVIIVVFIIIIIIITVVIVTTTTTIIIIIIIIFIVVVMSWTLESDTFNFSKPIQLDGDLMNNWKWFLSWFMLLDIRLSHSISIRPW